MTRRWTFWRRDRDADAPHGLSCREFVELVTDYLEGALSAADRDRFEAHLAHCDHCTAYIEQLRLTIRVTGEIPPEAMSDEMERELLAAFRDWKAGGV
jgi:anti-sigma factor RsiW